MLTHFVTNLIIRNSFSMIHLPNAEIYNQVSFTSRTYVNALPFGIKSKNVSKFLILIFLQIELERHINSLICPFEDVHPMLIVL